MRFLLAILIAASGAAHADDHALTFEGALAAWLADEDATALPALATLAQDGDVDARLLPGTVEHMGEVQTAWSLALTREERIALYRQPGGLSGISWLDALDTPFAALMLDLDDVNTAVETVQALDARGEARLAREGLRLMARREQFDDARAVVAALPELAYVAAPMVPGIEATGDVAPHPLVTAWCQQTCPAVATCAVAAADLLGSTTDTWLLGSPTTALISEADWAASAKGLATVSRLSQLRDPGVSITLACENS